MVWVFNYKLQIKIMEENWVKIKLDTEFNYEVSDLGRIRILETPSKTKYYKTFVGGTGVLLVSIKKSKGKSVLKYVNKLVLSSFYGGYYKQRKVKHINGLLEDCRLDNLEWGSGFKKGICLSSVKKIKNNDLDLEGIDIKDYLLTKNLNHLQNIINRSRGLWYVVLRDYKCGYLVEDFMSEILITIKHRVDNGVFTPYCGKRLKGYIYFKIKYWRIDYLRRIGAGKEVVVTDWVAEKFMVREPNLGDYNNLEDEISDMFSQLSN